jgi:phage terminase small subunit
MGKAPIGLTPLQERFCQEYVVDVNGTQAAIRAGYSDNVKAASVQAARLLVNARVVSKIQTLMKARSRRTELTADRILREIMKIAFSDLSQAFDDEGNLLKIKDMPRSIRCAIAGIDTEEMFEGYGDERTWTGYSKKLKLWDKNKALELLGKHLKLFTDKVEHSGKVTLEDLIAGQGPGKEEG